MIIVCISKAYLTQYQTSKNWVQSLLVVNNIDLVDPSDFNYDRKS